MLCLAALDLLNSTDITSAVTTLTVGDPASGQTNAAALFGFVNPGYYIAPFSFTPYACPAGSLCSGGEGLGDYADVDMPPTPCPPQTVLGKSGNSIAANGVTFSIIGPVTCTPGSDCTGCFLAPNLYSTPTGQVGLCPANYYCPGGGILGSQAPTSFLCTANSTLEVCNTFMDNVQSNSYAAGSTNTTTTIAAAAAPAVTVTTPAAAAPAVTVSPAAITVTPAPITVTPASQPITINVTIPGHHALSQRPLAARSRAQVRFSGLTAVLTLKKREPHHPLLVVG